MYYIKIIDTQNKKIIVNDTTKNFNTIKNVIDIFKIQNINANNIKIFLKYQNNLKKA